MTSKTRTVMDLFDGIDITLKIAEDILFAFDSDILMEYLITLKRFLQDLVSMYYNTANNPSLRKSYAQDIFNRRFHSLLKEHIRHAKKENVEEESKKASKKTKEENKEENKEASKKTKEVQGSLL